MICSMNIINLCNIINHGTTKLIIKLKCTGHTRYGEGPTTKVGLFDFITMEHAIPLGGKYVISLAYTDIRDRYI